MTCDPNKRRSLWFRGEEGGPFEARSWERTAFTELYATTAPAANYAWRLVETTTQFSDRELVKNTIASILDNRQKESR